MLLPVFDLQVEVLRYLFQFHLHLLSGVMKVLLMMEMILLVSLDWLK